MNTLERGRVSFSFCPLLLKCAFRRWEEKPSFWKRFCEYLTKWRMHFAFKAVFLQWKQRQSSERFLLWNYAITSLTGEKSVVKHLCVFLLRANSHFHRKLLLVQFSCDCRGTLLTQVKLWSKWRHHFLSMQVYLPIWLTF